MTTAVNIQEQARETYRQSLAAELPVSSAQLGSMYDRSERWGRQIIAEVKAETSIRPAAALPKNGNPQAGKAIAADAHTDVLPAVPAAVEAAERQSQRQDAASPAVRYTTAAAVVIVAAVAAVVSFSHMQHLAMLAGEGWRSWLLPASVDGLVVAASMSMLLAHRQGRKGSRLAWWSLLAGIGASLAANIAAAEPTLIGRMVAAWPPVALLLAYELLMQQVRQARSKEQSR